MIAQGPSLTVLVPTYRRPGHLTRCLDGVAAQTLQPLETIVVRRRDDRETAAVLAGRDAVRAVVIDEVGVLAALEEGLRKAQGEVVAFTDDDAIPRPDWLARLATHFGDPTVGAAGGRDIVNAPEEASRPLTVHVGRIGGWGKLIGNHHLGDGPPREVMVLKAVNMAFRRQAIALPRGLRGTGAQPHFEVAMSLRALRAGWRLIYDPAAIVDHDVGPRFDGDRRGSPENAAVADAAYNFVAALLAVEPALFWRRALYGVLLGDRAAPGFIRAGVGVLKGEPAVFRRLAPSLAGQLVALRDVVRGDGVTIGALPARDDLPTEVTTSAA